MLGADFIQAWQPAQSSKDGAAKPHEKGIQGAVERMLKACAEIREALVAYDLALSKLGVPGREVKASSGRIHTRLLFYANSALISIPRLDWEGAEKIKSRVGGP